MHSQSTPIPAPVVDRPSKPSPLGRRALDPNAPGVNVECIAGEQFLSPRPAIPHADVSSRMLTVLGASYQLSLGGPGGWYFLHEPEFHWAKGDILIPDIAGWRTEHFTGEMRQAKFLTTPPDWLCEVLSPSTTRLDRSKKLPVYAREGVPYVWLVDPQSYTIEVLRLENGRYSLLGTCSEQQPSELSPFGPVRLDLVFPNPPPEPAY